MTHGMYSKLDKKQQLQLISKLKKEYINQEILIDISLRSDIEKDEEYKELLKKEINRIKRTISVNVWAKRELEKTIVSDKEIKEYYKRNINNKLITNPKLYNYNQIISKDKEILLKIKSELDISNNKEYIDRIFKKYSKYSLIKDRKGYIYKFSEQDLSDYKLSFKEQLNSLDNNSSSIIKIENNNYSLIYLFNVKEKKILSLSEVYNKIEDIIKKEKFKLFLMREIDNNKKRFHIIDHKHQNIRF
jgi:peptidylprolyl isomerase